MADEFPTTCKDFSKDGKLVRAGCGLQIWMKKDAEGKWHPFDANKITPHKHQEPPKETKKIVQTGLVPTDEYLREIVRDELKKLGLLQ